jgi:hypothetical protein
MKNSSVDIRRFEVCEDYLKKILRTESIIPIVSGGECCWDSETVRFLLRRDNAVHVSFWFRHFYNCSRFAKVFEYISSGL